MSGMASEVCRRGHISGALGLLRTCPRGREAIRELPPCAIPGHSHADEDMTRGRVSANLAYVEEHAHADEGMAPEKCNPVSGYETHVDSFIPTPRMGMETR
jgi:hypothetical protein